MCYLGTLSPLATTEAALICPTVNIKGELLPLKPARYAEINYKTLLGQSYSGADVGSLREPPVNKCYSGKQNCTEKKGSTAAKYLPYEMRLRDDETPEACPYDRELTFVKSFSMTVFQDIPTEVIKFRKSVLNVTAEAFREGNKKWLLEVEKVLQKIDGDDENFPGIHVTYFPSNALTRMYEEVANAQATTLVIGYMTMCAFVIVSQLSFTRYKNMALLGFIGFLFVLLGNAAAYGLIALAGYKYNATMLQALPFLALGLGVDDLFLLLHAYKGVMSHFRGASRLTIICLTMMEAGASVTITSLCNACVFYASYMIPIQALQAFSVAAGTIVVFNWITAVTLVPIMFSVWAGYFETEEGLDGHADMMDSVLRHQAKKKTTKELQEAVAEAEALAATADPDEMCTKKPAILEDEAADPWWHPSELIERFYFFLAESMPLKVIFLCIGLGTFIFFAMMIPSVELGQDETDLAKRGTYLARGINDMYADLYSQHLTAVVVFGVGINWEKDQRDVLETHLALKENKYCAYGTAYGRGGSNANTWLTNMYGQSEWPPEEIEDSPVCKDYNYYNDSTDPYWAFYEDVHLWRKPAVFLNDDFSQGLAITGLFAALLDRANQWPWKLGPDDYTTDNKLLLSWDEVDLNMKNLKNTDQKIKMVLKYREICEESGLNIYMYGWMFIQLESLLNIQFYFWQSVAVSMTIVWGIALMLGMSWMNAMVLSCFSVMLCIEVYGSLSVWGIKLNSIAATSMIMSIGVAVEFGAHPLAAFEFSTGNRNERLAAAMKQTALPVLEGALSSFLGFCFLATSDFEFVFKYFFAIFLMICIFGTINALIFLPAILGLFGSSKKEIDPMAGFEQDLNVEGKKEKSKDVEGKKDVEEMMKKAKAKEEYEKQGVPTSTV